MGEILPIPLHLAVHVSGVGVAAGLAAYAVVRRREFGVGWLSLLVGASLLAASSVAQGGMWAEGLSWPLYLRAAGYAGVAFGAAGRTALPAVAVAVPAASYLVAGVAGLLAAAATVGGVLGRGWNVVLLSAGLALLAAGDLLTPRDPLAGALVGLVGSVAALAWLASRARQSLAARFVSLFGAVLLAVVLMLATASAVVFDQDLRADRLVMLQAQATAAIGDLQEETTGDLASSLTAVGRGAEFANAIRSGRVSPTAASSVSAIVTDADLIVLLGAGGGVLGSHDAGTGATLGPAATTLAGLPMVTTAGEQRASQSGLVAIELFDTEMDAPELLAVAVEVLYPFVDGVQRRDAIAGYVLAATRLTRADRIQDLRIQTGTEVAVLTGDALAGASTGQNQPLDRDLVTLADTTGGQVVVLGGTPRFVHVEPVTGVDGTRIGSMVLFEDASVVADLQRQTIRVLFLAAVLGGLVATVLAALVTARVTRPVRRLTESAERIARGDPTVTVDTHRSDEVGRLATSFGEMATALEAREQDLRSAATREVTLRERLEAVTASMDEALLAVDADGSISMANPAAGRLLEADGDALVGCRLEDVLNGEADDGHDLAAALGRPGALDVRSIRGTVDLGGRRRRTVAATAAPLLTDTGEPGRVIVLRDVSSEAEIERLKTEFVANAAHELRTPLTPVIGYAELLKQRPEIEVEKRRAMISEIAASAARLNLIVDKLINFADLEAGRAIVQPEPVDLSAMVDETLTAWRSRYPDRVFRRRLSRDLPQVLLDPRWSRLVLDELLDNAVKFSTDAVLVSATVGGDGRVRVEVRDRGVGIPEEAMADVRSEFRQADGSATRHFGGLGLGLAIVERILDRMGAELDITSRMGQGTHVVIVLPSAS